MNIKHVSWHVSLQCIIWNTIKPHCCTDTLLNTFIKLKKYSILCARSYYLLKYINLIKYAKRNNVNILELDNIFYAHFSNYCVLNMRTALVQWTFERIYRWKSKRSRLQTASRLKIRFSYEYNLWNECTLYCFIPLTINVAITAAVWNMKFMEYPI